MICKRERFFVVPMKSVYDILINLGKVLIMIIITTNLSPSVSGCNTSFMKESFSFLRDRLYTRWGVAPSSLLVTCLAKCEGRWCTKSVSRDVFTIPVWWLRKLWLMKSFMFSVVRFLLTSYSFLILSFSYSWLALSRNKKNNSKTMYGR